MLRMKNDSLTCLLPDGRRVGYAEYGDATGMPLLFCHGMPGSRHQVSPEMASTASDMKIRIIVPDRPGYGLSDPSADWGLRDWVRDVTMLMDELDIDRFSLLGYSMGGLYALGCAHFVPERITTMALVGSVAPNVFSPEVVAALSPIVVPIYTLARDNPAGLEEMIDQLAQAPDEFVTTLGETLSPPDKQTFNRPQIRARWVLDSIESCRNSGRGIVRDLRLFTGDWGIPFEAIDVPIHLWHGKQDSNAPSSMAEFLASRLPRCTTHVLPEEGHMCLYAHWQEILRAAS